MDRTPTPPVAPRSVPFLEEGPVSPGTGRAAGPGGAARSGLVEAAGRAGAAPGLQLPEWLATAPGAVRSSWTVSPGTGRAVAGRNGTGWAASPGVRARTAARPAPPGARPLPKAPAPPRQPSSRAPAPATAEAKPSGEWAFLSDPNTSIEDRLFRFVQLVQRKTDKELVEKMEDYRAKHVVGSGGSSKSSGSGALGFLKAIFPPAGIVDKLLGGDGGLLVQAIEKLGGPLLASLATAVGLPMLAPVALQVGDQIMSALVDGGGSGSTAKSEKKESGTPDERLSMLEIQRLVEKQNQMFALVSNLLKGMHETGMGVVNNIR
jgi:hypothetical protein